MHRMFVLACFVAGLLAAACTPYGSRMTGEASSSVAIDDVTNGLTGDPAANPSAGSFYQDGNDGDIRGRTENYFARDSQVASLDDVTAGIGNPVPPRAERMLIQEGDMRVEVARPDEAMAAFRQQVDVWGGHLSSQTDRILTVRIPAAKFEEAFAWVRKAGRVLTEARRAHDVTEEFVDLGIRLDTAKKSRDRLLEILQKADKVEDILKVEAELRRLTEEIERMEGRRKFLADQVAMSTLRVQFQATAEPPPAHRSRQRSRFGWVNRVGAEAMMGDF